RKCARLVDWLSFPPIPQIIGKGAPRIRQHATDLWESAPANLHRMARNHAQRWHASAGKTSPGAPYLIGAGGNRIGGFLVVAPQPPDQPTLPLDPVGAEDAG